MNQTIQVLLKASEGLLLRSETDAPFIPIDLGEQPESHLSRERLMQLLQIPMDTRYEEKSINDFFHAMTSTRPNARLERVREAEQFKKLQRTIETSLINAKVYRFGERRIEASILGWTPEGRLVGLRTVQVET